MTSLSLFNQSQLSSIVCYDSSDLGVFPRAGNVFGKQRLPTEAIGTTTVIFSGVINNSEIRVYSPDGTELAGVENCSSNASLSWNVFASGSPNNNVTIKIIHMNYKVKEFTYISSIGNQLIPIQQEKDKWYSNPI